MMSAPPAAALTWRGVGFSCAGALFSAAYLFPYKAASDLAAPHVLTFALLAAAAAANSAFVTVTLRRGRAGVRRDRRLFWLTAAALAVVTISGNFCGAQAVTRLEPAVLSVLLRTEVVFVGALGVSMLAERPTAPLVLGALIALCGLAVMRWPLSFDAAGSGALWALGAAASFGFMQVFTRRVIDRISPSHVNAVRLWLATLALALVPGFVEGVIAGGPRFWACVALAGLLGPCLGRLCIMHSLRTLSAAHSALLLLLAPVLAFALSYAGGAAPPTPRELLGGASMLLGIALPSVAALRSRSARGPA